MASWITPLTLNGNHCTLVPLTHDHHDELVDAVKDGQLWNLWYTFIPKPNEMDQEISRRIELQSKNAMLPFVIIDNSTGKSVGMTTYLNAEAMHHRVEIGGTWLRKSMHRTGLNTESKLLLLTHAFEMMACHAVEFRTHFCNHRSRRGIERLGAKLDGILRNHMVMPDKTLRDTCVYSIIVNEWPTVKKHLHHLIKNSSPSILTARY